MIPAPLLKRVTDAAEASYPEEACGLLVGLETPEGNLVVSQVEAAANVASGGTGARFEIDPRVRISLARRLRGGAERVIGHYHSHPDHPALPSQHDLKMAFEPELVWLITSVPAGRATETAAFCLDASLERFRRLTLRVTGPGSNGGNGRTIVPDPSRPLPH